MLFASVLFTGGRLLAQVKTKVVKKHAAACYLFNYPASYKMLAGRYRRDDLNFVDIKYKEGELVICPYFWTSAQHMEQIKQDSFVSKGHENLNYKINRSANGQVEGIELFGFRDEKGVYKKLSEKREPLELILAGNVTAGAEKLMARHPKDTSLLISVGEILNQRFTTKATITEKYLLFMSRHFPACASLFTALGDTYMLLGQNAKGISCFQKSVKLDPNNGEALINLRTLHVIPYTQKQRDTGFRIPFTLNQLFKAPKPAEIRQVELEWAARDLSVKNAVIADSGFLNLNGMKTSVYVISHTVHGFKHFGAVIIPGGRHANKMPAIIELKGVSPSYFPMNLNNGLYTYNFLCEDAARYIYIVPSFRGEKLIINGKQYLSEGDRSDAWDGATDDAISFLTVATRLFPQINQHKIAAFGKSRGGSIALLMGIRDKRIKYVLDWAGPVDWFVLMGQLGFTQQQAVEAGLYNRSNPFDIGGQFIERILLKNIQGKDGLAAARKRMIASSALCFLTRLPNIQAHYGVEDGIVPMRNGQAIQVMINKRHDAGSKVFFHPGAGHDLDEITAYNKSRIFLKQLLH